MSKFDNCNFCDTYKNCEYIKRGEYCENKLYSVTHEELCACIQGKVREVEIKHEDCDVRLDLIVEKKNISKLWGQVKNAEGNYVDGAMITLLKPQYIRGKIEYFPVATTFSDYTGFYQFEIDELERGLKYMVSVNKS